METASPAATGMVPNAQIQLAPAGRPRPHMTRPIARAARATTIRPRRKTRSMFITGNDAGARSSCIVNIYRCVAISIAAVT